MWRCLGFALLLPTLHAFAPLQIKVSINLCLHLSFLYSHSFLPAARPSRLLMPGNLLSFETHIRNNLALVRQRCCRSYSKPDVHCRCQSNAEDFLPTYNPLPVAHTTICVDQSQWNQLPEFP